MKEVDYIVVGLGIAGLSFCEQLIKNKKTFIVFDDGKKSSTLISAGVINPLVLKRFTPVWNAKEHISTAFPFYKKLSEKLHAPVLEEYPMYRIFNNVEEQNNWMVASDKNELKSFLHPEIVKNTNPSINAPFGFGKVNQTARVFSELLIEKYREYLQRIKSYSSETFEYSKLSETEESVQYKGISAKKIVFAEGASVRNNPFFPKELLIPNKGEFIVVKVPGLQFHAMLKSSIFIISLGNDLYKVGATYDREDISYETTGSAKEELMKNFEKVITAPYEVVSQIAGIRPTTKDRRPLLGTLNASNKKVFFSGLGTRGIISSPSLSQRLYRHLECGETLDKEINIQRYYKY
ncbi:MAG: glycine oxidase [Saprospiraceae bacterium]|jgi:glycine oxidase|uniref:NAD(P)/FAD-dependent oxidoreductase n=1 Tax=Candidatus Marifrigoribacter sp. Uisw_064 TaxID=3230970 RepID=UPI003AE9440F